MTKLIDQALYLAYTYHDGIYRKDGITPYIVHPIEVFRLLQKCQVTDEEILAAALCHDLLEDTKVTPEEVRFAIGDRAYDLVVELTMPKGVNKEDYIAKFATAGPGVILIKAADRICNVKDYLAAGGHKYALKYLNKGEPIYIGLDAHRANNPICASLLLFEWDDLKLELEEINWHV